MLTAHVSRPHKGTRVLLARHRLEAVAPNAGMALVEPCQIVCRLRQQSSVLLIAREVKEGVFYFVDRYKRSIIRPDGLTVHPSPIENEIMRHKAVRVCAVVGLQQFADRSGSVPTAFVVLGDGYGATEEAQKAILLEADAHCAKTLPDRDRAGAYLIVPELPYTDMQKVNFRELEKTTFEAGKFLLTDVTIFPELLKK